MRNGLLSFAEVSRRVFGEVENADLSAQLERFVLAYNQELIGDVIDLKLMDYGYERYEATLTVRAKYDADQAKFLLLIADLKSDIYQKFGYITTIEPEIPAAPVIQEQVKEVVCRKLDGNLIMAENTRVNKGIDRLQAVIYIFAPFS